MLLSQSKRIDWLFDHLIRPPPRDRQRFGLDKQYAGALRCAFTRCKLLPDHVGVKSRISFHCCTEVGCIKLI
jgi:hypothetical protein